MPPRSQSACAPPRAPQVCRRLSQLCADHRCVNRIRPIRSCRLASPNLHDRHRNLAITIPSARRFSASHPHPHRFACAAFDVLDKKIRPSRTSERARAREAFCGKAASGLACRGYGIETTVVSSLKATPVDTRAMRLDAIHRSGKDGLILLDNSADRAYRQSRIR